MNFTKHFIDKQSQNRVFNQFSNHEISNYFKRITNLRKEIIGNQFNDNLIEGYFKSKDNIPVYFKYWEPNSSPKRVLIMIHGLNCHSDLYFPLADYLFDKNTILYALDLRGHGRTGKIRGNLKNFNDIYSDLKILIIKIKVKQKLPIYLMGESLGALIVLNYSCKYPENINGIITLAPGIIPRQYKFIIKIYPFLKLLFSLFLPILNKPIISIPQNFDNPTYFSSFIEYDRHDLLHLKRISLNLLINLLKIMKNTLKTVEKNFKIPILICQGTGDTLLDYSGAKLLYNKININDKKIIYYKNANHSLLFDKNSIKIYYDLLKWIKSH